MVKRNVYLKVIKLIQGRRTNLRLTLSFHGETKGTYCSGKQAYIISKINYTSPIYQPFIMPSTYFNGSGWCFRYAKTRKTPVGCIIYFNFPQKYNFLGKPLLPVTQVWERIISLTVRFTRPGLLNTMSFAHRSPLKTHAKTFK